jgi:hypothetical protein
MENSGKEGRRLREANRGKRKKGEQERENMKQRWKVAEGRGKDREDRPSRPHQNIRGRGKRQDKSRHACWGG